MDSAYTSNPETMIKKINIFIVGLLIVIGWACLKENELLNLDQQYLQVADVAEFCQGSCNEIASWEQQTVLVKGYLRDTGNDSIWNDNAEKRRFNLLDIRNGMSLEIRVEGDQDIIFNRLKTMKKLDLVFIRGTAIAVIAQDGDVCTKGVVLLVFNDSDIIINLE